MTVIERGDLETVITSEVQSLKASEEQLSQRFRKLRHAPEGERIEFVRSLWELERKATRLEELIQSLDNPQLKDSGTN